MPHQKNRTVGACRDRSDPLTDSSGSSDRRSLDGLPSAARVLASTVVALAVLVPLGCRDGSGTLQPTDVSVATSLELQPDSAEGWTGDSLRMKARALDEEGRRVEDVDVTWTSSDTAVATVDTAGLVSFRDSGSTTISANTSSGSTDLTASTSTKSKGGKVTGVDISPDSTSVAAGDSVQLAATVIGRGGTELDKEPAWTSLDEGVAAVDADGTVTGLAAGTARIEAHKGSARDTATVVVTADTTATDTTATDSTTAPSMPSSISVTEESRTDTTVSYTAAWSSSDSADSYDWNAGSSADAWSRAGTVSDTTASFTAPRSSAPDSSYACVVASNDAGSSESRCTDFTVPEQVSDTTSTDTATVPSPPTSVSVTEDARTDSTVRYLASWNASDGADSYDWNAGSNGGLWSDSGSGLTSLQTAFTAPRGSSDDGSYFCASAVNDAGTSESACTGFTVPAAPTDTSTSDTAGADPIVVEDFSSYSSTLDLLSDPLGIYDPVEDVGTSNITLDTSTGVDIDGYSLSQSMRYTFPNNGGACEDQSISRSLNVPSDTYVVWVEWYARFDADFTTDSGNSNCTPAYKFLFGRQNTRRFDLVTGLWGSDFKIATPSGYVENIGGDAAATYDGQWHRYRIEFRHESSDGASDGAVRFWLDDTLIAERTGLDTDRASGPMEWVELGANLNQGPNFDGMGLNWGRIAVWTSDPGW